MSGLKNLANALANDPSFKAELIGKKEAAEYVPQGQHMKADKFPKGTGKHPKTPPEHGKSHG